MPTLLGLVADDLTGAGDAAAGFAERGWRVVLSLRPGRPVPLSADRPTVLAVSTGCRAAPDDEAAERTAVAVDAVVAAGAERLYLKIDSTVRGSVSGQIQGALTAWSQPYPEAFAVVCPAFPAQGRTVNAGRVLVDGVPVGESAAATDPVSPRTVSDLTTIVSGAVRRDVSQLSGSAWAKLVVDAPDEVDLDRVADALSVAGPEVIMVGSGGLAAALGRTWPSPGEPTKQSGVGGRVLIAVSSLHPATAGQLHRLQAEPITTAVDVLTTHPETTTPAAAAEELAGRVVAALAERPYGALVIVGGDGAGAILAGMAADLVAIDGALVPGCPTGILAGGVAGGLRLVTKSGGFGDPGALAEIISRLGATGADPSHDHHHAESRPIQKEAS